MSHATLCFRSQHSLPQAVARAARRWRAPHLTGLGLLLCLFCVGCRQGTVERRDGAGDGGKLTIAVIPKSVGGDFWETVEQGAVEAAAEMDVDMKWEGTLTETEIAEQNRIIENMLNLGVDGMAIAPLNAKATWRPIESVLDAGLPVVIFDSAVQGDGFDSFVATNNLQGGVLAGQHMAEIVGTEEGKVFILRFLQGTGSTEARAEGFVQAAESAGLNIVADTYPEDGTTAGAKKTATNYLERYVQGDKLDLEGIFACNLVTALGMSAALDDLRKSGIEVHAKFIGFDTSPELLKGLHNGEIDALISQDPRRMGYLAVETLVKRLRGEEVESFIDTGVEVVTKERLENEPKIRALVGEK
ncbi:MAG: substrate-binding domain-containing protein [Planctomycetales bacterium]|nr:substrate-binding domain-containing protein [Planctomycetales bacterium]